jgi:hypothetical protein
LDIASSFYVSENRECQEEKSVEHTKEANFTDENIAKNLPKTVVKNFINPNNDLASHNDISEMSSIKQPDIQSKYSHVKILQIQHMDDILSFHIQINDKVLNDTVYLYSFKGIKSNFEIVLECEICNHLAYICPNDILKNIIFDKPENQRIFFSKDMKLSNPLVTEMTSYDTKNFEINLKKGCLGLELDSYLSLNTQTDMQTVKILKVVKNPCGPLFHIQINDKIYFYSLKGISSKFKIILKCNECDQSAFIRPTDILKKSIFDNRKRCRTISPMNGVDFSDPRMYELSSYDLEHFEIYREKACLAIKLDSYMKNNIVEEFDNEIGEFSGQNLQKS